MPLLLLMFLNTPRVAVGGTAILLSFHKVVSNLSSLRQAAGVFELFESTTMSGTSFSQCGVPGGVSV